MKLLVSTLGGSWAVIPELLGLLNPDEVPLYHAHPERESFERLRADHGLQAPDEVWLCTTQGGQTDKALENLRRWRDTVLPRLRLRAWQPQGVKDIRTPQEARRMRELIFRCVLRASEHSRGEQLLLSLSGGRKTMSTDIQRAADFFGADALLHVLGGHIPETSILRDPKPDSLVGPLGPDDAVLISPLVLGAQARNDLLDIETGDYKVVVAKDYPLVLPPDGVPQLVPFAADDAFLSNELERRERQGSRLLGNYLSALEQSDPHSNWHSLYQLPPRLIRRLREDKLEQTHLPWLEKLPKADLHRHIGGCLHIKDQVEVARAVWGDMSDERQAAAMSAVQPLLDAPEDKCWDWDWPQRLKHGDDRMTRAERTASLLLHASRKQLFLNLYEVTEPRHALNEREPHRFAYYERPGELSGSALLGHSAALEPYLRLLIRRAKAEGLAYLELRGSPQKYRGTPDEQFALLQRIERIAAAEPSLNLRFIVILDRRHANVDPRRDVELAVRAHRELDGFVCGIDLAGDETTDTEETLMQLREAFLPAFEACLPITIHAGEGTSAESIWQAAYLLHADRVGHGLKLLERPELLRRFRDRGIGVEMCPTSNDEVVGFNAGSYPFQHYWREGLPLALCTDNPGISRTTAAGEILKANDLSVQKLSLWDALAITRQGFRHAFLPATDKRALLQTLDQRILEEVRALLEG